MTESYINLFIVIMTIHILFVLTLNQLLKIQILYYYIVKPLSQFLYIPIEISVCENKQLSIFLNIV